MPSTSRARGGGKRSISAIERLTPRTGVSNIIQAVDELDLAFGSTGIGRNDLEIRKAARRELGFDGILGDSGTGEISPVEESKRGEGQKIPELELDV